MCGGFGLDMARLAGWRGSKVGGSAEVQAWWGSVDSSDRRASCLLASTDIGIE